MPDNKFFDEMTGRGEHDWFVPDFIGYECCRKCGIVRRADGKNKPCRGRVTLSLRDAIAERDRLRGRQLSDKEQLDNLTHALGECDSDCASRRGNYCNCGAREFRAKFGPSRYTP